MGFLSKRLLMPIGIGAREQLEGKVDIRCLGLSGWINFIYGEIGHERMHNAGSGTNQPPDKLFLL